MEYSFGIPSNLDFHLEKRHQNLFTPPHAHHHFEFLFMLDGSMEVSVEETTCVLDKYEIMIIMPYQIHEYKSIGNSTAFVFEFPTKYITEYETNFQDKTFKYPKKKLSEPFLELFKAFSEKETHDIFQTKSVAYYLMSEFSKNNPLVASNILQNDTFRDAVIYITKNYKNEISLKKVAEFLGITPVYLSRTFTKKGKGCFTETVNTIRLREANYLLRNTNMSIGDVAAEVGFKNARTFNRVFKERYNHTPKQVRNKIE